MYTVAYFPCLRLQHTIPSLWSDEFHMICQPRFLRMGIHTPVLLVDSFSIILGDLATFNFSITWRKNRVIFGLVGFFFFVTDYSDGRRCLSKFRLDNYVEQKC